MNTEHRVPRFDFLLACASVALALLSLSDLWTWNAGVAFPDEMTNLQWLQEWREGVALPLSFAKGSLHRWGLALLSAAFGPSTKALHLLAPLAFLFECLLLYALAKRFFGARAACWAVVTDAAAVFTWIRLRSLLSYSLLPLELLLVLWLLLGRRGALAAWLAGLASGFFLLDYDAWLACLPILALAWKFAPGEKADWKPALAGFALALSAVIWLSWSELRPYVEVRASQNAAPLEHFFAALKAWWLGGNPQPHLHVQGEPAFPAWAWLPLAAGLFRLSKGRRWLLAWAALGFLPLMSRHSVLEPQRAIAAWPALCLLAGLGMSWLCGLWGPLRLAFGAAALLLACVPMFKFFNPQSFHPSYGRANDLQSLGRLYGPRQDKPVEFLVNLDHEAGGALQFLMESGGYRPSREGDLRALVPREYAPGLPQGAVFIKSLHGHGGHWRQGRDLWTESPDSQWITFYVGEASSAARFLHVNRELSALFRSMPRFDPRARRRIAVRYLAEDPRADPWIRTALLEHAIGQSFLIGEFPAPLVAQLEKERLCSASALAWSASKLAQRDPAWAQRLAKLAAKIDPPRFGAP